ncbi:hypothetical protein HYH03_010878 [Edaphochlamys debaryana]|uniref:Glycosyltransferase n=1 Tax=Edaphochlamys debaryana TaxID=47281 RepID=A0A836BW79_9CHLO|nr:hypothetical protein HYH03_010878 [Edaphochlamys debaryana]|eukprot:KAG2490722.1 hypothetical protein HYH03_010878 [Edaphochlamys debaryana]
MSQKWGCPSAVRAALLILPFFLGPCAVDAGSGYTIYNDIYSHWHVFAGVIAAVRKHIDPRPDLLWMAERQLEAPEQKDPPFGLQEWLGDTKGARTLADWRHMAFVRSPNTGRAIDVNGLFKPELTWGPVDTLVCVSPELDQHKSCVYAAKYLKAKSVIALIHRGDFISSNSWFLHMRNHKEEIPVHLLAIVPHVVTSANQTLKGTRPIDWALTVAPYTSPQPCKSKDCMAGFVVQGSMRYASSRTTKGTGKFIRDYDSLWRQMRKKEASCVRVKILGRGVKKELGIPKSLEARVDYYSGIPFPEYWELIDKSYALVPFHNTPQYYTTRCSSTVLASLTTCVPLIADDQLLKAYYMFKKEHVFYQAPGESEMDVMTRVMALPEEELLAKRAAVCRLRDEQLKRGAGVMEELVASGARRAERRALQ